MSTKKELEDKKDYARLLYMQVACKMLSLTDIFFQWGKVYIVDTDQGVLIKKVMRGTSDDTITLVSENTSYEPFEISRRGIYNIALVMGLIRAE